MKWLEYIFGRRKSSEADMEELKSFVRSATTQELFDKEVEHYMRKDIEQLKMLSRFNNAAKTALEIKTSTTAI